MPLSSFPLFWSISIDTLCYSICYAALLTTLVRFFTSCSLFLKLSFENFNAFLYIFNASSN